MEILSVSLKTKENEGIFILLKTLRDKEKNLPLAFMGIIKHKHFTINTVNGPSLTRQNQSVFLPVEEHCHNDQGTNEFPLSVCLESCLGASFMINAAYIVPRTQSNIMLCDRLNNY